jgi:endoglucanase Acf2
MTKSTSTTTDLGKLTAFQMESIEKNETINEKMSLQPLTLTDGSYTSGQLSAFAEKAANSYQSLVEGDSMKAADYAVSKSSKLDPSDDPPSSSEMPALSEGSMAYIGRQ